MEARRTWAVLGVALAWLGACQRADGDAAPPTMRPGPVAELPQGSSFPAMPTAPYPAVPPSPGYGGRVGIGRPPLRGSMTPPAAPLMLPPVAPVAPVAPLSPADAQLRASLNGTWSNVHDDPPTPEGHASHSECRLVIHAGGAQEICRTTTTLGSLDPSVTCDGSRDAHVRTTSSPYALTVAAAQLTFTPGLATVVGDNACSPAPAGRHTLMTGTLSGTTLDLINDNNASSRAAYQRVN